MNVWVIRYYLHGEEVLEVYTEEWRARAYLDCCTPEMRATLHELVERIVTKGKDEQKEVAP